MYQRNPTDHSVKQETQVSDKRRTGPLCWKLRNIRTEIHDLNKRGSKCAASVVRKIRSGQIHPPRADLGLWGHPKQNPTTLLSKS